MADSEYEQWVARGRAHQGEGRPIDAMLCYRRAIRAIHTLSPRCSTLAKSSGGWRSAAIATWRDALRDRTPASPPPAQALAEALLADADAAGAANAAAHVLSLVPGDARAELIAGIAALVLAEGDADAAAARVVAALVRDPSLLTGVDVGFTAFAGHRTHGARRGPSGSRR